MLQHDHMHVYTWLHYIIVYTYVQYIRHFLPFCPGDGQGQCAHLGQWAAVQCGDRTWLYWATAEGSYRGSHWVDGFGFVPRLWFLVSIPSLTTRLGARAADYNHWTDVRLLDLLGKISWGSKMWEMVANLMKLSFVRALSWEKLVQYSII